MANHIERLPRGRFREYRVHWVTSIDGPKLAKSLVGEFELTTKQRALMAMQRAERRGRTGSWAYRAARAIALREMGYTTSRQGS